MLNIFPPKIVIAFALLSVIVLTGCMHQKTNRGHLVRGDWAIEYNRTPWIGCPDDADCEHEGERKGLFSCLKDREGAANRAFRRHCATIPGCTSEEPCCRTLGCGMWVEPTDENAVRVCGLTPFCFAQKPCGLTPNCGKPNVTVHPHTLMHASPSIPGGHVLGGHLLGGMSAVRGMNPAMPAPAMMPGTLVSRGIVPGASAITSGGMVAAIGVATPAGTMTPVGVRMPNGSVSNAMVLRACVISPSCTAARPCGQTPHCGGAVAVNLVANNAIALASALQAQGTASAVMQANTIHPGGGVMSASGMGLLINPMTGQPVQGQMMGSVPQMVPMGQAGQMPIDHAGVGMIPGHPHYLAGMVDPGGTGEVRERHREEVLPSETRSQMPVPKFHPIPTQPTFQRSEGMMPAPHGEHNTAMLEQRGVSEEEFEAALDEAYLQGVAAAMEDVERKLEAKRQAVARAKLEERILQQSESVQQQIDEQARIQVLAMQHLQQERQLRQPAAAEPIPEPQRIPPRSAQSPTAVARTGNTPNVHPLHLAESFKTSVASGVHEVFAPLLSSHTRKPAPVRTQPPVPATSKPQQEPAQEPALELAESDVPGRPPVAPTPWSYGLLPDSEPGALVLQAQFVEDGVPIRP